jgi:hypothetical protein
VLSCHGWGWLSAPAGVIKVVGGRAKPGHDTEAIGHDTGVTGHYAEEKRPSLLLR